MAVLRLSDVRPFKDIDETIDKINCLQVSLQNSTQNNSLPTDKIVDRQINSGGVSKQVPAVENSVVEDKNGGGEQADSVSPIIDSNDPDLWNRIEKEIVKQKSVFSHYFISCQFLGLDDSGLHLQFADSYTRDLVDSEDKLKIIRQAVLTVTGQKADVRVTLAEMKTGQRDEHGGQNISGEKKKLKVSDKSEKMNESEIIQEALDIFGGVVVR